MQFEIAPRSPVTPSEQLADEFRFAVAAGRLCFGLMACAVATLPFMRFALRLDVPVGGPAQLNILLAASFLYAIPGLVGALEVGRGPGTFRLLQAAPVAFSASSQQAVFSDVLLKSLEALTLRFGGLAAREE